MTYRWYGMRAPRGNYGESQVCELDHLIALELGGADGLGNIWPECGPSGVALEDRYFKMKDRVENYLADEVKSGRMSLRSAQRGIASEWTQYLEAANRYCAALVHSGVNLELESAQQLLSIRAISGYCVLAITPQ